MNYLRAKNSFAFFRKKRYIFSPSMGIFDELKSVGSVLREADKIEQYQLILDVQAKLLDMQKKIADLEVENKALKDEINIKKNLVHRAEVYYLIDGDKEDGPFCTMCYDTKKLLVRLKNSMDERKICPNCKILFCYK